MELAAMPDEKTDLNKFPPGGDADDIDEEEGLAAGDSSISLTLAPEHCGLRMDKVLSMRVPQYSRNRLQQWIEAGHVTVNGQPVPGKTTMLGDETIIVRPQTAPEEHAFKPEPMDLPIVHEDASIIVLDKPAGMAVHPSARYYHHTITQWLAANAIREDGIRPDLAHRLDRETSGVLVCARGVEATRALKKSFARREIEKSYIALVTGRFAKDVTTIDLPMRLTEDVKVIMEIHPDGYPSLTEVRVLRRGRITADQTEVTLLECRPKTGRQHQIRVHLKSIGHVIFGDATYGWKPDVRLATQPARVMLHAEHLVITHPKTGKELDLRAPLPADFAAQLTQLRQLVGREAKAQVAERVAKRR